MNAQVATTQICEPNPSHPSPTCRGLLRTRDEQRVARAALGSPKRSHRRRGRVCVLSRRADGCTSEEALDGGGNFMIAKAWRCSVAASKRVF
jgi:hypothetical protein